MKTRSVVERLSEILDEYQERCGPDSCWEWKRSLARGYGGISVQGRRVVAHRFIWERLNGRVPDGLHLDHLCRNTCCVNPRHLEPVTPRENTLRSTNFIAVNAKKTHCPKGHPLSGANLYVTPAGGRSCRKCTSEQHRVTQGYKGYVQNQQKTHCKRGHEFTKENTYFLTRTRHDRTRYVERVCRECGRVAARDYQRRKAQKSA